MTQEDKELLLKVLCAMLPYGVTCKTDEYGKIHKLKGINKHKGIWWYEFDGFRNIKPPKPYLRSLSSMTKEEREELEHLSEEYFSKALDKQIQESLSSSNKNESRILEYIASSVIIDWLNSHHFDYSGLIEKGLALEAPEGMYKEK